MTRQSHHLRRRFTAGSRGCRCRQCSVDDRTLDLPKWRSGSVDNYTMHGRRTFTGTRKVLASLVAA